MKDGVSEADYVALAPSIKEAAIQTLSDTFESSGASVLVSITNLHSSIYASAGFPAITVPLGLRSTGMPTGATLIEKSGADSTLIGYAFAFEQATNVRIEPDLDTLMESVAAAPMASPDATPIS